MSIKDFLFGPDIPSGARIVLKGCSPPLGSDIGQPEDQVWLWESGTPVVPYSEESTGAPPLGSDIGQPEDQVWLWESGTPVVPYSEESTGAPQMGSNFVAEA